MPELKYDVISKILNRISLTKPNEKLYDFVLSKIFTEKLKSGKTEFSKQEIDNYVTDFYASQKFL